MGSPAMRCAWLPCLAQVSFLYPVHGDGELTKLCFQVSPQGTLRIKPRSAFTVLCYSELFGYK